MDGGVSWAAVHRVAQSWTWLKWLSMHACIGEGNGNPLQYSCLENPRDRGAWWAAVYGVAQSQTRLKRLSSSSSMTMCSWTPGNISKSSLHTSVVPRLRIIDLYHFIIVMSLQWSLCWEIHAQKFKGTQILQRQIQSIWSKGTQIPRRNESSIFV